MPDREDTLKKAERLVRQGKLDAAIAEYLQVVEDQPADWTTANTLGDLYVRAGKADLAAGQYARIAEHFMAEGFYSKASALYKKLLKLTPGNEVAELNLAEISQKQGLLADAKARLTAIEARRRGRHDRAGAAEIVLKLGSLDPADFDARTAAARMLAEMGRDDEAAAQYRAIHDDLVEKDRAGDAAEALRQAVELNPQDRAGRAMLAKRSLEDGDVESARRLLDNETAAEDPALRMALFEIEIKANRFDTARALLPGLVSEGPEARERIVNHAWVLAGAHPEAAFVLVEAAADAALTRREFSEASGLLKEFVTRVPRHIPALLKLVEVCVDGGLEAAMYETQAELADAYLATGQAAEARLIAEDLVAREPWEREHIDRFRRALVMLKVDDPDSVIAVRLSGHEPFTAKDIFAPPQADPPSQQAPAPDPGDAAPPQPPGEPSGAGSAAPAVPEATRSEPAAAPGGQPDGTSRMGSLDRAAEQMALARTYLEMRMPEQALEPLKSASEATRFRFEAASLLGRLYGQRGETADAIEWLERAAEAPAPSEDEGRALLYDLGMLVEQTGDTSRALAVFLELQADAGDYRDVAERVERLARVETGG